MENADGANAFANWQRSAIRTQRVARTMASSGQTFAQDGVFRRFLKQKGGIANIFMATFCCALSVRLLQQRKENEDRVEAMEGAFAAERESLRAEIDALKGRGWFSSRAAEKSKPARRETRAGGEGDAAAPPPVSAADKKAVAKGGIFV